jgi:hypothetical protein|tara:strand:- start:231 stop:497 length:267 start_codon:yes stop_codon:yes gene_type:complete
MKKGNLVMLNNLDCPASKPGLVLGIDKDYYGARQAFKVYAPVERGKAIRGNMVDGIGPTKDGICDRVLVYWPDIGWAYQNSKELKILQ